MTVRNNTFKPAVFRDQPFWFRMINHGWKLTYPLGKINLSKDSLIKEARNKTGLYDLGRDFREEPLDILLKSMEYEAALHPVGRFIARQRFVGLLSMRLRAEYFFKKYPEILDQELYPAWIIVGLQRTGTTKLQRLLAADPDHRVVYSWEAINPVPLSLDFIPGENSEAASKDIKKRISVAKTSAKGVEIMSPAFNDIHPIKIYEPEEDILVLDVSFMSTTPEAMMPVPSYAKWLEETDQSAAYEYGVKIFKLLQWQQPAKRWILKSPHHLEFTDVISRNINAKFLWPHRSIYESIPSFLSMVTYTHMMFSEKVDPDQIAKHWVRKTGYMLNQALKFRQNHEEMFIDLDYKDLIDDSVGELSKIYSLNGGLSPELKSIFESQEKDKFAGHKSKHRYSLEDFGLTTEDIDKHTMNYQNFKSGTGKR